MKNKIIDFFRKKKIFKLAIRLGQDIDGDIIIYKNVLYCHNIKCNKLVRVNNKDTDGMFHFY